MTAVRVYGLARCDRCRQARRWLAERGVEAEFVDLARDGLDAGILDRWLAQLRWDSLLNRRSTSWRALAAERREGLDHDRARTLMLEEPRLVKRPVLEAGDRVRVGFDAEVREWLSGFTTAAGTGHP